MNLEYFECSCTENWVCGDCEYLQLLQDGMRLDYYPDYAAFRRTLLWTKMSEFVKTLYGNRCANLDCLRTGSPLVVHHENYRQWGTEKLADLVCVCQTCHDKLHGYFSDDSDCLVA
jgi:hypothetical protein